MIKKCGCEESRHYKKLAEKLAGAVLRTCRLNNHLEERIKLLILLRPIAQEILETKTEGLE